MCTLKLDTAGRTRLPRVAHHQLVTRITNCVVRCSVLVSAQMKPGDGNSRRVAGGESETQRGSSVMSVWCTYTNTQCLSFYS